MKRLVIAAILLSGCGGGGGDDESTLADAAASGSSSGATASAPSVPGGEVYCVSGDGDRYYCSTTNCVPAPVEEEETPNEEVVSEETSSAPDMGNLAQATPGKILGESADGVKKYISVGGGIIVSVEPCGNASINITETTTEVTTDLAQ